MLDHHLPLRSVVRPGRYAAAAIVVIASSLSVGEAHADEGDSASNSSEEKLRPFPIVDTGPQAGFRTGFAMGFGKFQASSDGESASIGDNSRGMLPFWLDVGYRVHPNVYIGAYGQFGLLFLREDVCGENAECSGQNYRVGGNIHYHFVPDGDVDPWFGLGAGYEWYRNSTKFGESGLPNQSVTFKGPEWVNVQLGLDIKDTRQGGIGPFVALSVGQYTTASASGAAIGNATDVSASITAKEMHQFFFFGVQGSYFDDML